MKRPLYEVWEDKSPLMAETPWRAQLVGYVAEFKSRAAAESFVESVKKVRKALGLV